MESSTPPRPERRAPSRLPYVLALLFMGGVVAFAWFGRGGRQAVIAGEPAPTFTAETLDGETRTLESYEGKVVLLNVWATWCPPCREEMPSMQRLYEIVDDPDFEIVAISVDADVAGTLGWGNRVGGDVQDFVDEMGLTFPILWDPSGRIADVYQTIALPESFLIGRDGIIYRKVPGATFWDDEQYVAQIERLLDS